MPRPFLPQSCRQRIAFLPLCFFVHQPWRVNLKLHRAQPDQVLATKPATFHPEECAGHRLPFSKICVTSRNPPGFVSSIALKLQKSVFDFAIPLDSYRSALYTLHSQVRWFAMYDQLAPCSYIDAPGGAIRHTPAASISR